MSKQTAPDLKELFKQASEIAQQVPESMQEAAFNRALDLLTGSATLSDEEQQAPAKRKNKGKSTQRANDSKADEPIDDLLSSINSTAHPGVAAAGKVLDRSLMVLQIALSDHGVDGLSTGQIAKILADKFRISTTANSVNMALSSATEFVDRVPHGQGFLYRIMAPGEKYLAHLGDGDNANKSAPPKRKSGRKKGRLVKELPAKKNESKNKTKDTKKKINKKASKTTTKKAGQGPKAAVISLIESGFFANGRTGPEVQAHLKNKRGLSFGTDPLRITMLRLVRDEDLDRDLNEDGQYEYKTHKS